MRTDTSVASSIAVRRAMYRAAGSGIDIIHIPTAYNPLGLSGIDSVAEDLVRLVVKELGLKISVVGPRDRDKLKKEFIQYFRAERDSRSSQGEEFITVERLHNHLSLCDLETTVRMMFRDRSDGDPSYPGMFWTIPGDVNTGDNLCLSTSVAPCNVEELKERISGVVKNGLLMKDGTVKSSLDAKIWVDKGDGVIGGLVAIGHDHGDVVLISDVVVEDER